MEEGGICIGRRRRLLDPGRFHEIFCILPPEHGTHRERPHNIPPVACEELCKCLLSGCGRPLGREDILCTRHHVPLLEPVYGERLDDAVVLVAEDDVSLVEELDDQVISSLMLADVEGDDALDPVLPYAKHSSSLEVLSQQHCERGRVLRRSEGMGGEVCPSSRLDQQLVTGVLLSMEADDHDPGKDHIDFIHPQGEQAVPLSDCCPDIDAAYALFGGHGIPN
ncbi:MAG: hypothetical protein A4E41_00116 [Methanoregulaceae archaeon PtaU1.Bin066]|nr:MAG: hypothetical protein A4E41_00116 [Methanoregulaceae archaeon PtaU1.Bin066]